MMRSTVLLAVLGMLIGCSASGVGRRPQAPTLTPEELGPIKSEFASLTVDHLIEENRRLINLEYALTTASGPRCGALSRPQSGMILSRSRFFKDRELRKTANRELNLDESLRVLHVVPGSSVDEAGVRAGDGLLSVDGKRLKESARLRKHLLKVSDRRAVDFVFERDGELLEKTIDLEFGCPVVFKLTDGFEMIARAPMQLVVVVTPGVMSEVEDDDTLAVVLAHELAHTCFDDKSKSWLEQEKRADRLGLILAAQAGFKVDGAEAYWERVAMEYPWLIDVAADNQGPMREGLEGYTHYGIGDRLSAIRATVSQIKARMATPVQQPRQREHEPTQRTRQP